MKCTRYYVARIEPLEKLTHRSPIRPLCCSISPRSTSLMQSASPQPGIYRDTADSADSTCQSPMPSRHLGIHTLNKCRRSSTHKTARQPFHCCATARFRYVIVFSWLFQGNKSENRANLPVFSRSRVPDRHTPHINTRTDSGTTAAETWQVKAEKRMGPKHLFAPAHFRKTSMFQKFVSNFVGV